MHASVALVLAFGLLIPVDTPGKDTPKKDAEKPVWTDDITKMTIPEKPVSGMLRGMGFTIERAELLGGVLTLRQGKEFFPDAAVKVFLFLKKGESVEGKSYRVVKELAPGSPHVHMLWMPKGDKLPKREGFVRDYLMILEFGKAEQGKVTGKVYLCLPDEAKSVIAGTFTLDVK